MLWHIRDDRNVPNSKAHHPEFGTAPLADSEEVAIPWLALTDPDAAEPRLPEPELVEPVFSVPEVGPAEAVQEPKAIWQPGPQ